MAKNGQPAKPAKPVKPADTGQVDAAKQSSAPTVAPTNSAENIAGLEVVSTQEGFRRAGFAWSKAPTFIALDDLTDAQIEQLYAEPMLTVREVERRADELIARASK